MTKKISFETAKALSIQKWEHVETHAKGLWKLIDRECGFCWLNASSNKARRNCGNCLVATKCNQKQMLFSKLEDTIFSEIQSVKDYLEELKKPDE